MEESEILHHGSGRWVGGCVEGWVAGKMCSDAEIGNGKEARVEPYLVREVLIGVGIIQINRWWLRHCTF